MSINLAIDDVLIEVARRIGAHKTKRAIGPRLRKQRKVLDLFGTIDFDPNWNYKKTRVKHRG
jgi:hypothetical protein